MTPWDLLIVFSVTFGASSVFKSPLNVHFHCCVQLFVPQFIIQSMAIHSIPHICFFVL